MMLRCQGVVFHRVRAPGIYVQKLNLLAESEEAAAEPEA